MVDRTPLPVIAHVSRVVTKVVDRVTGDRVDYPLLVTMACVEALKCFGIESRAMYGQAAWIEVLEDHTLVWAGCWGQNLSFWVATQFGEIVDLNTSVACRKSPLTHPNIKAIYSPPILWSTEVPRFYKYLPEGVAELELTEGKDQKQLQLVIDEVLRNCKGIESPKEEFPNEPILCPGRKLLDDSRESFRYFDRALSVQPLPPVPF